MTVIGECLRRLWYLVNRSRLEAALEQEMEAHRAMMDEPGRFGNRLRLREQSRDVWGWLGLDNLARDVRLAVRALRRTPSFTIAAILSLGLGLALTGVTVSIANAYLIRSLPYPDAQRRLPCHVRAARAVATERHDWAGLEIYGVTAYAVQQRRKEVAIRIALGASDRAVARLFLRNGAMLLGAGTLAGLAGGMAVSRVLRHRIYGVDDFDITTYVAACVGLVAIGLIAMWWPVRRMTIGQTATTLNAN